MTPPTAHRGQAPLYILQEGAGRRPQHSTTHCTAGLPSSPILLYPLQHRSICLSLDDKGNISRYSPIRSLQFTLMSVGRGCLKTSHGARFLRSFAILQGILCFCLKLRRVRSHSLATSSAEMVRVGGASSCSRALHDGRANFITDRTRYGETRVRKVRGKIKDAAMGKQKQYACMGELVACMRPMTSLV